MYTCSSFLSSLGGDPKHLLVVGQEDGRVTFLNMWNTKNYMHIDAHTSSIDAVETSRDQRIVLTNGTDGEMKLWDATRPIRSGNSNSSSNRAKVREKCKIHARCRRGCKLDEKGSRRIRRGRKEEEIDDEEGGAEADESTHIQLVKVQAVLDGSAPDETDAAPALPIVGIAVS